MWTRDDNGDLINLEHMESIMLMPIQGESQEAPEGHTHEILAINPAQESYRLRTGTKEDMQTHLSTLTLLLKEKGQIL